MKITCALIVVLAAVCFAEPPIDILPPHLPSQTLYEAPTVPSYHYGEPSTTPPQTYLYEPPSNEYLPTIPKKYGELKEPNSNYNFAYTVKDKKSGNDYGHKESKQGKKTVGEYFVLLPDGRKQIVTYEADENGYRPKIRYEQKAR